MSNAHPACMMTLLMLAFVIGSGACSPDATRTNTSGAGAPDAGAGGSGGAPDAPDASTPDPSDAIYNPEHVLDVVIDMAPADWDALRYQGRNVNVELGEGCLDGPKPSPYTYFPATVTVDGQKLEMSGVRKKGFLGSASLSKPSLKISFDEYVPARELSGVEGLTLNNSRQDPSLVKTCLAMKLFREAGLPASRCSFATVTVNGDPKGVYVNIEPVNKRLLARYFADNSGNLYEGQLSDVRAGFSATYQKKTNEADPDRSDLDAVTAALSASDAALEGALGKVVDINEFTRFWAMEALLAAWDGSTNNLNNHFIYHDPTSGKMAYIPWGPDMSFDANDPFSPQSRPQSVSAKGALAERLYKAPIYKQGYVDVMKQLLGSVWKESDILAEIDRIQAQVSPHLGADAPASAAAASSVRSFVSGRRATITSEITPAAPIWPYPAPSSVCLADVGAVSGTFSTTFGTLNKADPFVAGTGTFTMTIAGAAPMSAVAVGAVAGDESGPKGRKQITVVGSFPDGKVRALVFNVDPEVFTSGKDGAYDWQSIFALGLDIPAAGQAKLFGLAGDGTFHLDKASSIDGAPVSGTFTASLLANPFN